MKKQSRLAVLLAAVLALATLFTGVAFATAATELNATREDVEAALSAEEVQAEVAYQQLLACTSIDEMYAVLYDQENGIFPMLYSMNQEQLNGAYSHAMAIYNPETDDADYYEMVCDGFAAVAADNEIMLLKAGNGTLNLNADTTLTEGYSVESGATFTIDLQGHTLSVPKTMRLATVRGTMIIKDSVGGGKIISTGTGNAADRGGAIYIASSGKLEIQGGTITGFSSYYNDADLDTTIENIFTEGSGGAIYVQKNATFKMTGGTISNCSAFGCGGAVFINENGSFEMTGGTISNCTADNNQETNLKANSTVTTSYKETYNNQYYYGGGAVYVSKGATFTMSGAAKLESNTSKMYGGAVQVLGTMTMDGSAVISGNNSGPSSKSDAYGVTHTCYGGGVFTYNNNAVFTMNSGTITNNIAASGGGVMVWTDSKFIMNGGTISDNMANGEGGLGNGGAVYVQAGTFNFNGGTLSGNTARRYGGAVNINQTAIFNLTGATDSCIVENNSANYGGGLSQEAGDCAITLSSDKIIIRNNTATNDGGGLFIEKGILNISAGSITQNTAGVDGGGIALCVKRITGDVTVNLTGGEIVGNIANANGGGINIYADHVYGTATQDASQENENKINDVVVNLKGGTLRENKAIDGAGVHVGVNEDNSTAKVYIGEDSAGTTMTDNVATGNGGAVSVKNGNIYMYNGTATLNNAVNGGFAYVSGGDFTMSGGTIGCENAGNAATANGGAVYVTGGSFTMSNGSVTYNSAANNGGAVYMDGANAAFTMSNGSISNNSATANGGAVYMANGNFTMEHGTVDFNSANNGGAVYMAGANAVFKMESGSMSNNSAVEKSNGDGSGDGGAIYAVGGTLYIGLEDCTGSTVDDEGNITDAKAAAHKEKHGSCNVDGCSHPLMQGNTASDSGGAIAISKTTDQSGTVYFYCGNAIKNEALYKGVGKNVFMDGGKFYYYNGANVGVPRDPDLVIVGGELINQTEGNYIKLMYYSSNDADNVTTLTGLAKPGAWINLPDAEYFWATQKPENTRFFGWTAKGTDSGTDNLNVRSKNQYIVSGTAIEVTENQTTAEAQKTWDGTNDGTIHLYALWAPETSTITYVERVWNYPNESDPDTKKVETYTPTSYKIAETSQTITVTAVDKPGYELTGWYIYQNEGKNANWGYEPVYIGEEKTYANLNYDNLQSLTASGNTLSLQVESLTFGDITLIAEWKEKGATITYQVVGPDNQQSVGGYFNQETETKVITVTETIGQATGEPTGATAIADYPNYKFVDWYTNQTCSTEADNNWITDSVTLVPRKTKLNADDSNETALYQTATYYAKFAYNVADLTINKSGLQNGDSVILTVQGYNADDTEPTTWTIVLTAGDATAVIKDLRITSPYTITEKNDWSVYYENVSNIESTIAEFNKDGTNPNSVTISNEYIDPDKWLHDESAVDNVFGIPSN